MRDNGGTLDFVEGVGTCWTPDAPKPGDVVLIDRDYSGLKPGALAVIDGSHFGLDFDDGKGPVVLTVANGSAFRGKSHARAEGAEYVSVSGGPCPFVPIGELTYVGKINQTFWRWIDYPRRDGGENYTLEVALWAWK